jgi:hypothetical protein
MWKGAVEIAQVRLTRLHLETRLQSDARGVQWLGCCIGQHSVPTQLQPSDARGVLSSEMHDASSGIHDACEAPEVAEIPP